MSCPTCDGQLTFRYRYEKDSRLGFYIAEGYQFCPKCSHKRLLTRTTETGEILFASRIPSIDYEYWLVPGRRSVPEGSSIVEILQKDVETAPGICLVADDDRRYTALNRKAAEALGVAREDIVGRRIDEFFVIASDIAVTTAWDEFIPASVQLGICELISTGARFRYRARANFLPGLHISWLRPF
jgi:PAS domain-containing protein